MPVLNKARWRAGRRPDLPQIGRKRAGYYLPLMRARFILCFCLGFAAAGLLAPYASAADRPGLEKPEWLKPPAKLPHVPHENHSRRLDRLFAALKTAPDDEIAKAIEARIWATWMASPSDTAMLLMTRVRKAIEDKDLPLAIKLLNGIIKIRPDYVEAWNERATIYFGEKKFGRAIADLRQVLLREPRHFGALSGLGMILQEIGDDKEALEAYRRALAVYPRLDHVPDIVKKLSEKVEGRDI